MRPFVLKYIPLRPIEVFSDAPLVAGGSVDLFNLSPDGLHVSYIADQKEDDVWEVFNVALSAPAAADGFLADFTIAPGVRNP